MKDNIRQKLDELNARIRQAEQGKKQVINLVQKTLIKYQERKISLQQYKEILSYNLNNKSPEDWIKYYDHYIHLCNEQISSYQKQNLNSIALKSIMFASSIFLILMLVYFILPSKVLLSPEINIYADEINLTINTNQDYEWFPKNLGTLQSLKFSGSIKGNGPINIYLENMLILNSSKIQTNVALSPENELNVSESQNELNISIPTDNIIIEAENATNITEQIIENKTELIQEIEFTEICEETCNLSQLNLNKSSYILRIEITDATLILGTITYEILTETPESPPSPEPTPKEKIIKEEIKTKKGKKVMASIPEGLESTNLSAQIPKTWKIKEKNSLEIYWEEGNKNIDFNAYDLDNDSNIDKIEWLSPSSGNQTFNIIVITKAEHLDSNKNFISNIYEEVKTLDNLWSESIPSNDFIRVTFEKNLTSNKDITIFPRIISGTPKIEVYEINSDILIAEFSTLQNNQYNKIFLTNLNNNQNTFDLKVLNGEIEINHIIDPSPDNVDPNADIISSWSTCVGTCNFNYDAIDDGIRQPNTPIESDYLKAEKTNEVFGMTTLLDVNTVSSVTVWTRQMRDGGGTSLIVSISSDCTTWETEQTFVASSTPTWIGTTFTDLNWNQNQVDNMCVRLRGVRLRGSWGGTKSVFVYAMYAELTYIEKNSPPTVSITSVDDNLIVQDNIVDLQAGAAQTVRIIFDVEDPNGPPGTNLDESTLAITYGFPSGGPFTEQRTGTIADCTSVDNANIRTYTCDIDMQYYDSSGSWDAVVDIDDTASIPLTGTDTNPFTVNLLRDISLLDTPISFGVVDIGQQVPTTIRVKNNGNSIVPTDNLQVTSGTLGSLTTTDIISSSQFKAAGTPVADACTNGAALSDISPTILNAALGKWNGGAGSDEETLTFCLDVPSVEAASYAAASAQGGSGEWTITILATLLTLSGGRKKKKKSLSLNKENLLETINEKLKDTYNITLADILSTIKKKKTTFFKDLQIPIEIFKQKIGAAESISKFLKENKNLKFNEIAILLNRDQRTIALNYKNAIKKKKDKIIIKTTQTIPLNIFSNRKLSILESLIIHLRGIGLKNKEISKTLNKDPRNTYTLYSRAVKKLKA